MRRPHNALQRIAVSIGAPRGRRRCAWLVGRNSRDMEKYRVIIRGQNVLTEVDGVRQRLGFYTNVFVEALSPADAQARAIELLRKDSALRDSASNAADNPVRLTADRVEQIESFDGVRLPRSGLVFYQET